MQDENKVQSPYRGFWVILLCLIGVPLATYFTVQGAVDMWSPFSARVNALTGRALGFGVGSLFHLTCLIGGLLKEPFRAVLYRLGEFKENLRVSVGFAFACYWDDMKSDGVVLLICLVIIGACAWLSLDAVQEYMALVRR